MAPSKDLSGKPSADPLQKELSNQQRILPAELQERAKNYTDGGSFKNIAQDPGQPSRGLSGETSRSALKAVLGPLPEKPQPELSELGNISTASTPGSREPAVYSWEKGIHPEPGTHPRIAAQRGDRSTQARRVNPFASRLLPSSRTLAARTLCAGLNCQPCRVRAGIMAKPAVDAAAQPGGSKCLWCETAFPQGVAGEDAKTHIRRHHRLELLTMYGLQRAKTCQVDGQNYLMVPLKRPAVNLEQVMQALPLAMGARPEAVNPGDVEELVDLDEPANVRRDGHLGVRESHDIDGTRPKPTDPPRPIGWRRPAQYQKHILRQPHHMDPAKENEEQTVDHTMAGEAVDSEANKSFGSSSKRKISDVAPRAEDENGTTNPSAKRQRKSSPEQASTGPEASNLETMPSDVVTSSRTVEASQKAHTKTAPTDEPEAGHVDKIDRAVEIMSSYHEVTRRESRELAADMLAREDAENAALGRAFSRREISAHMDRLEKAGQDAGEEAALGTQDVVADPDAGDVVPGAEEASEDHRLEAEAHDSVDDATAEDGLSVEDPSPRESDDDDFIPREDMYCSRCLRKAPKMNDRSSGRSTLGRDVELKFHADPNRSCRIANRIGDGANLPNQSGWIPAAALRSPLNKIKDDFIRRHPAYRSTVYPPRVTKSIWKFDPNNETNSEAWGLEWPPAEPSPPPAVQTLAPFRAFESASSRGRKRRLAGLGETRKIRIMEQDRKLSTVDEEADSRVASDGGGSEDGEPGDEAGSEGHVPASTATVPRPRKKRKLAAARAELDETYRPTGDDDIQDAEDAPSAEAVAREIREAEISAGSRPATTAASAAAPAEKSKRLPPSREADESLASSGKKTKKKATTLADQDKSYRPGKGPEVDREDAEAEPTAEEVAAEIQKPAAKKAAEDPGFRSWASRVAAGGDTHGSSNRPHELGAASASGNQEREPTEVEGSGHEDDHPSKLVSDAEGDRVDTTRATQVSLERPTAASQPTQQPPAKGLGGMFSWRGFSASSK